MIIDYDKVDLMGQLDSMRRGWQACEVERDALKTHAKMALDHATRLEAERDALAAQNERLREGMNRITRKSDQVHFAYGAEDSLNCAQIGVVMDGFKAISYIADLLLAEATPTALEELRRRERSIGAEDELWRFVSHYPEGAVGCNPDLMLDRIKQRADAIRDAREKGGAE